KRCALGHTSSIWKRSMGQKCSIVSTICPLKTHVWTIKKGLPCSSPFALQVVGGQVFTCAGHFNHAQVAALAATGVDEQDVFHLQRFAHFLTAFAVVTDNQRNALRRRGV